MVLLGLTQLIGVSGTTGARERLHSNPDRCADLHVNALVAVAHRLSAPQAIETQITLLDRQKEAVKAPPSLSSNAAALVTSERRDRSEM